MKVLLPKWVPRLIIMILKTTQMLKLNIYIYIQVRKHLPLVSVEKKCKYIMLNIGLVSSELKKYIYIGY